ncbi:MAG: hypothetical protein HHJ12_13620 [Glaciimonas sp.]|nr:hypothetical protein [Glaciimonas sp.]
MLTSEKIASNPPEAMILRLMDSFLKILKRLNRGCSHKPAEFVHAQSLGDGKPLECCLRMSRHSDGVLRSPFGSPLDFKTAPKRNGRQTHVSRQHNGKIPPVRAWNPTLLQIPSVSVFEKTLISCALQPDANQTIATPTGNQLILFDFEPDTTAAQ